MKVRLKVTLEHLEKKGAKKQIFPPGIYEDKDLPGVENLLKNGNAVKHEVPKPKSEQETPEGGKNTPDNKDK